MTIVSITTSTSKCHPNNKDRETDPHLKELQGGTGSRGAVLNGGVLDQVVHRLYGLHHALHGQEGGQVGRVRRNDDHHEEPPGAANDPTGH